MDYVLAFSALLAMLIASRRLIMYFQLASYQFYGYYKTIDRQRQRAFMPFIMIGGIETLLLGLAFFAFNNSDIAKLIISVLMIISGFVMDDLSYGKMEGKNRLVITARVKRFYIAYLVLIAFFAYITVPIYPVLGLVAVLAAGFVFLAGLIAYPFERLIYELYIKEAKKILNTRDDLKIVGITGSFGKTSLKFYLKTILSQKYSVLCTRKSANTPMGLCAAIRNDLLPSHNIFIAEMGARHRWDIKELTRLVKPDVGILSSVGPQHLETMGGIAGVEKTKYDLIRALPKDGFAVFGEDLDRLYEKTKIDKCICGKEIYDYWSEEKNETEEGTSFVLCGKDGTRLFIQTKLKGAHAIRNIEMAVAVAKRLGLSDRQISFGVAQINAVKNRFKIEKDSKGAFIINNGFNSNPVSSRETLYELSKDIYKGRKIIITPGFIELGKYEEQYHREFGENIAKVADIVLLVGPSQTKNILEGLKDSGFDEGNIFVFTTLKKANEFLSKIKQAGDYILYENDLTESHSEQEGIL